mmetsp:Transcript_20072/g.55808  ORF Transcript_20072/g.55808 Transcript_20072/m.55808 type:complete len:420 (-) Transcript_20072:1260-2519(-)
MIMRNKCDERPRGKRRKELDLNESKLNRIQSNPIESNRIKPNQIESNRIRQDPTKSKRKNKAHSEETERNNNGPPQTWRNLRFSKGCSRIASIPVDTPGCSALHCHDDALECPPVCRCLDHEKFFEHGNETKSPLQCSGYRLANERRRRHGIVVDVSARFRKNHRRGRHHQTRKEEEEENAGLRNPSGHGREQVAPVRFVRLVAGGSNHGRTEERRGVSIHPETHPGPRSRRHHKGGANSEAPCPGQTQRSTLCKVFDGTNEREGWRQRPGIDGSQERQTLPIAAQVINGAADQHWLVLQPGVRTLPRRILPPADGRNDDGRHGRSLPRAVEKHPQRHHPRHYRRSTRTQQALSLPGQHGPGHSRPRPDHHRSVQPHRPAGTRPGRPGGLFEGARRPRRGQSALLFGRERRHPARERRL